MSGPILLSCLLASGFLLLCMVQDRLLKEWYYPQCIKSPHTNGQDGVHRLAWSGPPSTKAPCVGDSKLWLVFRTNDHSTHWKVFHDLLWEIRSKERKRRTVRKGKERREGWRETWRKEMWMGTPRVWLNGTAVLWEDLNVTDPGANYLGLVLGPSESDLASCD